MSSSLSIANDLAKMWREKTKMYDDGAWLSGV